MSGAVGLHEILGAAFCAGAGGWMLFFHDHYRALRQRQHERDLAARLARGSDAYFEQLRALRAYPPGLLPAWQRRLGGALMLLFGFAYLALAIAAGGRP
jgi:hypothetical protein